MQGQEKGVWGDCLYRVPSSSNGGQKEGNSSVTEGWSVSDKFYIESKKEGDAENDIVVPNLLNCRKVMSTAYQVKGMEPGKYCLAEE